MIEGEGHQMKSTLGEGRDVEDRMDAIRLKQMLDPESLTDQELMCLQIELNGFGCSSCSG
jgi:hypothetical protein